MCARLSRSPDTARATTSTFSTPSRTVVLWRYPLVDVLHTIANYDAETGWGDWGDWYYHIYPDGVAVKNMHLCTDGSSNHEWQESMVITGPDQHPEQVVETEQVEIVDPGPGAVDVALEILGHSSHRILVYQ